MSRLPTCSRTHTSSKSFSYGFLLKDLAKISPVLEVNKRKAKRKDILACIPPFGPRKVKQRTNQRVINNVSKRSEKMGKAPAEIERKLGLRMNSSGYQEVIVISILNKRGVTITILPKLS